MMRAALLFVLALPLAAQAPVDLVRRYRDSTGAPSVSVAVGAGGRVVWAEALGTGITTASQYRIGSVSKPMTAAALMRLVE